MEDNFNGNCICYIRYKENCFKEIFMFNFFKDNLSNC